MARLDHISIPVRDWKRSRDWYVRNIGFEVEFEMPEQKLVALRDDADLTVFMGETDGTVAAHKGLMFTIQVADVDATYEKLSHAGTPFLNAPKKLAWGYGAELLDPDGYLIGLWDEKTMKEKSGT